jgi:hypothetical protein
VSDEWRYVYGVESEHEEHGRVCISLVRRRERDSAHHLRHHIEVLERTVLFSRSFRAMLDTVAIESYTAHLALVARHAQEGTFGCFAQTRSEGGRVDVLLYERWFDGDEIRTEELARRAFDAGDEQSLVASVEFLADLRAWAERRNQEREAAYLEERRADDDRKRLASEQEAASRELHQILAAHARGS